VRAAWLLAVVLAGCGGAAAPPGTAAVRLALNWFPEHEHGGYFAADVHGLYAEAGLAVQVLPGGPGVAVLPRVAAREVDFGVVNADDVVAGRAAGAAVVALLAPIHESPWCVMVHAASGIARLEDLHDVTLAMTPGTPYTVWLERHAPLRNVRVVPYGGSIAEFLVTPAYAQQAYLFSEPLLAAAKGADARCLPIAATGFDPYASVLVASTALVAERPAVARAFTEAAARGWRRYLDEPGPTNARIVALNPELGAEAIARGVEALRPLVADDAARTDGIGSMRADRWTTLVAQMRDMGLIDTAPAPASLYDARFVPPAQ
jgi:NitT/TauT family transport system substrate-binding protein